MVMNLLAAYNSPYSSEAGFIISEALFFIIPVLLYLLVLRYLILKTQNIINLLKLENGMEETRIDLSIPFEKLLRITVILIGGILLVSAIPSILQNFYLFITEQFTLKDSPRSLVLITSALQAIIGFLVMNNSDVVLRYIQKKSGESETKQLDKDTF